MGADRSDFKACSYGLHSYLGTTAAQRVALAERPWTWSDIATYPRFCRAQPVSGKAASQIVLDFICIEIAPDKNNLVFGWGAPLFSLQVKTGTA